VTVDLPGNAYLTGFTHSTNFPLSNPFQPTNGGGYDAFASKLNPAGSALVYSTYLGGSGDEIGSANAIDGLGDQYVVGQTASPNYPLQDPLQSQLSGTSDAFVTKLASAGTSLLYSTYLGGSAAEIAIGVSADASGHVYVVGGTFSTNFPTLNPYQPANGGGEDAFIVKLGEFSPTPTSTATPTSTPSATATATATPTATNTATPTLTATAPATSTPTSSPTVTVTPSPTLCPAQFEDVPPGSTFYDFIRCLVCRGIINGYPCGGPGEPCPGAYFRPYTNVTRGQIAKIVANSAGFAEAVPSDQWTYEDVPPGSTFWEYVERLSGRGYINGYPCGSNPFEPCVGPGNRPYYRPNTDVTRGQLSKIVANAAQFTETPTGQTFEDVPPGSTFYLYIERLSSRGIIGGYPCGGVGEPCVAPLNRPYFRVFNNATRGQTSKIDANTFFPGCQTPVRR
jgi:hypothetical protein